MGYSTVYCIKIYADTPARKTAILQEIAVASSRPLAKEEAYTLFEKDLVKAKESGTQAFIEVIFERKWWDPIRDFRGGWYNKDFDLPSKSGMGRVEDGINLQKGERLEFACKGDNDDDFWMATVTPNGFVYRHCTGIDYTNKKDKCENDNEETGELCTGCGSCAGIIPTYEPEF